MKTINKIFISYPNWEIAFCVNPVKHVATASINVVVPKLACIGTSDARKAAVAPSQHSKTRKLKNPTTNCKIISFKKVIK